MSDENILTLKSVYEFSKAKFFVPSYQRGYRWTIKQVNDLLEDILDFKINSDKDDFYCIQPLVLKRMDDNEWEVIDGQQRLTTIFIILKYFNDRLAEKFKKQIFSIEYQTREDSSTYLYSINENDKEKNIDYFFIYNAYVEIIKWFSNKENQINDIESTLLNRVKVIWYEVDEGTDSIEIFTRINMGKIPLTNAELIKALFLRNRKSISGDDIRHKQLRIASEWDTIENTLQKDSFWYFIYDGIKDYPTRIEFIFDLMKNKKGDKEDYYTFNEFNKEFENNAEIDIAWKEIKDYFMTFEEWYNDRTLYHLIGLLITSGEKIDDLKNESKEKTKSDFKKFLKDKIKDKINFEIEDLDYDTDKDKIRQILLLFNIETLLTNENSSLRFPFDLYKKERWDIEHIRAIKDKKPRIEIRKTWLEGILYYFTGIDDHNKIKTQTENFDDKEIKIVLNILDLLAPTTISETGFDKFYEELLDHFNEADEPDNINSISNLTLLDSNTNRSYKNSMFPIKRKLILQKDKSGTFIPICTKNVFLKYYSNKIEKMLYWDKDDAEDYLKAIKQILEPYLINTNE